MQQKLAELGIRYEERADRGVRLHIFFCEGFLCKRKRKYRNFTKCDQVVSFSHAFVIALSFLFSILTLQLLSDDYRRELPRNVGVDVLFCVE